MLKGKQAFRYIQLPTMEESIAIDRGLLQRADRRGIGAFDCRVPDEISPLGRFKMIRIPHHPHISSLSLRSLLEARSLGTAMIQLKEAIWDCRKLLREWEYHYTSSGYHSIIFSFTID